MKIAEVMSNARRRGEEGKEQLAAAAGEPKLAVGSGEKPIYWDDELRKFVDRWGRLGPTDFGRCCLSARSSSLSFRLVVVRKVDETTANNRRGSAAPPLSRR